MLLDRPGGGDLLIGIVVQDVLESAQAGLGESVPGPQQQHPVSPHGILLAAPPAQDFAHHALADLGEHLVAELDQVEVVHADVHGRQHLVDRGAERGRGIDGDHLEPIQPGFGASGQPGGDVAGRPSVDDAEHVPGVGVDKGAHPRLDPAPDGRVGVFEPLGGGEPVLVDAQRPHRHLVDLRQDHGVAQDGGVDGAPRQAMRVGGFRGGPAGVQHRGHHGLPQPGGTPGPGRQLVRGLREGPARAGPLGAQEPGLDDNQLQQVPTDRDVLHGLADPLVHPAREHPAARAGPLGGIGSHNDTPASQWPVEGLKDGVTLQVEHHRCRRTDVVLGSGVGRQGQGSARTLGHGSCPS
ncbi:hypothetical protein MICRO80W_300012 [Micrococcus luteus]|nr:hypothetical protein MICRO80W_300012 [Micrococcus luteus]